MTVDTRPINLKKNLIKYCGGMDYTNDDNAANTADLSTTDITDNNNELYVFSDED